MRPVPKPYPAAIRDAPDYARGQQLVAAVEQFRPSYPGAMRSLTEDLDASLAHLKLPPVHRKNVRTTNLIERSFAAERRRAKIIPRFRGAEECLKLVFGVLWRASERWQRVRFTEPERKQIVRCWHSSGAALDGRANNRFGLVGLHSPEVYCWIVAPRFAGWRASLEGRSAST